MTDKRAFQTPDPDEPGKDPKEPWRPTDPKPEPIEDPVPGGPDPYPIEDPIPGEPSPAPTPPEPGARISAGH